MTVHVREAAKRIARYCLLPTPSHLLANQRQIDASGLLAIERAIKDHYHQNWRSESSYSKEMYEKDLSAHLHRRLESDRQTIIPWLDSAKALKGRRVLEIGCGTGSSTVAIAEQGAKVVGLDIDEGALSVAKERSKNYGLDIDFRILNADKIVDVFGRDAFDFVIFFACLEHMTNAERLASLRQAWSMLPAQGLLVIVETPNRLWYFDSHTSKLPFFHWLPNDLAFQYSRFSSRENFRELYRDYTPKSKEHFLRRGRGMSFHELDIALGSVKDLNVISSLGTFQGSWYRLKQSRMDRRYKSILMNIFPGCHEGFFDHTLYLIIQKQ